MGSTIFCVDDSPTIIKLIKKVLEPEGYNVLSASNGQEALSNVSSQKVDFFIVDVNMPQMNGFEFVGKIKEMPVFSKTPVVFLTTESSDDKKEMGKKLGVNGWMVKPFEPETLLKIIDMLID